MFDLSVQIHSIALIFSLSQCLPSSECWTSTIQFTLPNMKISHHFQRIDGECLSLLCNQSSNWAKIFFFCPIPVLLSKYQKNFTSLTDLWQEIEHFLFLGKGAFSYSQVKWDDSEIDNHASKSSCLDLQASLTMEVNEKMIEAQNFVAVVAPNQWKWVASCHMAVALMKFERDIHHCLKLFTITLYYKTQLE